MITIRMTPVIPTLQNVSLEWALQVGIWQVLDASQALKDRADIYDAVPQADDSGNAAAFPYVVIGEDIISEWDTDTETGGDATVAIHTWSRDNGRQEIKELQGIIYGLLHRRDFDIPGYFNVGCDFVDSQSFLDSDGKTRHGIQTFRVLIDQLGV